MRINFAQLDVRTARRQAESAALAIRNGTLEVGKAGDVVILADNPLEDVANFRSVETVIKGGEIMRP